ncbi:cytochrome b/b6 domain-containing protein [Candidatus Poribacteria bacterium]|nr:cytochrome b/b6 domain-containing protein [Candidatus Poribacteria bacterium]
MQSVLVWDWPTRLFHWLLAAGFLAAAAIAFFTDDDGAPYPYHAMIGLLLALMAVLRVVWGFVGTRHARFASFAFGPRAVIEYIQGILTRRRTRHAGHNPGSAHAIFLILALVLGLAVTGILMGRGVEDAKDVHEVLAYVLAGVAGAHVLGVLIHTLRLRENITLGMFSGEKVTDPSQAIPSARPVTAALLVCIAGAGAFGLLRNYDAQTRVVTVPIIHAALQIGEQEDDVRGGEWGEQEDWDD